VLKSRSEELQKSIFNERLVYKREETTAEFGRRAPEEHDIYSLSLVFNCAPAERNDISLLRSEENIGDGSYKDFAPSELGKE
jgi:hypothetical protein